MAFISDTSSNKWFVVLILLLKGWMRCLGRMISTVNLGLCPHDFSSLDMFCSSKALRSIASCLQFRTFLVSCLYVVEWLCVLREVYKISVHDLDLACAVASKCRIKSCFQFGSQLLSPIYWILGDWRHRFSTKASGNKLSCFLLWQKRAPDHRNDNSYTVNPSSTGRGVLGLIPAVI